MITMVDLDYFRLFRERRRRGPERYGARFWGFHGAIEPRIRESRDLGYGSYGVFKIEKGIEKTGGLCEALGMSAFCFRNEVG